MIQQYNDICRKIVKKFTQKLFREIYDEDNADLVEGRDYDMMEYEGVVTGIVEISDMYYNLDDILVCMANNLGARTLYDYTNKKLDGEELRCNYYNYAMYKIDPIGHQMRKDEELKESEEAVKIARQLLEEAIKNYKGNSTN